MSDSTQGTHEMSLSDGRVVKVSWFGATDTGRRRDTNQDSFLAEFPLFVVADGMGGHAGGELASRCAVSRLQELVDAGDVTPGSIERALQRATEDIAEHPEATDEGTGTTVTGVFLSEADDEVGWTSLNIGDSRVYLLRDDALEQVTTDHSVVAELVATGRISPEEAESHPYSNVITRAVGASETTVPDYVALGIAPGDRFVICSDGLTKELTDYGLLHFLQANPDPAGAVQAMMKAALENGGRDNITIIVLQVQITGTSDDAQDFSSTVELTRE